jgi:hypothetical protein
MPPKLQFVDRHFAETKTMNMFLWLNSRRNGKWRKRNEDIDKDSSPNFHNLQKCHLTCRESDSLGKELEFQIFTSKWRKELVTREIPMSSRINRKEVIPPERRVFEMRSGKKGIWLE